MPGFSYLNGEIIPTSQATIPVADLSVLYGIGLFETMRARHGSVFRLNRHLQRLLSAARKVNLPVRAEALPDESACRALLERNQLMDARLRLTVTGGTPGTQGIRHTELLTAAPLEPYPTEYYTQGITVQISPQVQYSRDPLAGLKSTCYWPRLMVLHAAQLKGCAEALWFNEENALAEGCISNVFVIAGDRVRTPPLHTPVLDGITREVVLEECGTLGIDHQESALTIDHLLDADEVFVTNCLMGIVPVVRVERKVVGKEAVGPITHRLMDAYRRRTEQ